MYNMQSKKKTSTATFKSIYYTKITTSTKQQFNNNKTAIIILTPSMREVKGLFIWNAVCDPVPREHIVIWRTSDISSGEGPRRRRPPQEGGACTETERDRGEGTGRSGRARPQVYV